MKKELGLLEGVAVILGMIIGSGIFISPKGILQEVGSIGVNLIVWVICGLLAMVGALCYTELGTCIPRSGGDYIYLFEAFGPVLAFLYLWATIFIITPTSNAIMALTFSQYVLQPVFANCGAPDTSVRLVAAAAICLLTFINCYGVKETTRVQNFLMFVKVAAILIVIITGFTWLLMGHSENFQNLFENTSKDPGKIAVGFYSGIFSYSGWNFLNFMTDELKRPYVNLPRAIYISMPFVTLVYLLANVAYLAALTPEVMLKSDAIAVTFGNKLLGSWSWIISVFVAISSFGGLSIQIMASSRVCFVAANKGHLPALLSHVHIKRYTPVPSLIFLCLLSLIMLTTSDVFVLIAYSSIVETTFIMLSVIGLLKLRHEKPTMERPIKVPIFLPILFVIICIFLIILPMYERPVEVGMGIIITLSGIPAYLFGVVWKNKPLIFHKINAKITHAFQKVFMSANEEHTE